MPSLISPITSGAIDAALNSLIHTASGGSAGNAEEPRTPLIFSSRQRQIVLAKTNDRLSDLQRTAASQLSLIAQQNANGGVLQATVNSSIITGQEIQDLTNQLVDAMPYVSCELNPHSIEFDQPKRYSRQDTQNGTTFHHFTNDKGENNDIVTIRFQGNTGNLSRRGRTQEDRDRAILRLAIWHNLWQLTREPMLLSDGTANIFYIDYASALFPVPIRFEGFFTRVLKFSENAKKPNSRDFDMEFIVQATSPDLNTLTAIILDFVTQQVAAAPNPESKVLGEQG